MKTSQKLMFWGLIPLGGALAWQYELIPTKVIERVVEVETRQPSLNELLAEVPAAYGLPVELVQTIIEVESGGRKDAVKHEPSHLLRAKKLTKNEGEAMMLASSHGYMQVMGWWSRELGFTWSDLYDPRTNIEVGCTILRRCLDRSRAKTKAERYFRALTCYNGSEKYASQVMNKLSAALVEKYL